MEKAMNKTKFEIGDKVTLKYSSNPGQKLFIERIRSNARGENEYQLSHHSLEAPMINKDWYNEETLARG